MVCLYVYHGWNINHFWNTILVYRSYEYLKTQSNLFSTYIDMMFGLWSLSNHVPIKCKIGIQLRKQASQDPSTLHQFFWVMSKQCTLTICSRALLIWQMYKSPLIWETHKCTILILFTSSSLDEANNSSRAHDCW